MNYKTSKDYNKLLELLNSGKKVICFIYQYSEERDIAMALVDNYLDKKFYEVRVRGVVYFVSFNTEDFINNCELYKLEFVLGCE